MQNIVSDCHASRLLPSGRVRDIELPEVIHGDDFIPRPADDTAATSWHGTPTARGHHRGPVRMVTGIGHFDKVRGDEQS
jgi:hypothetical protein